MVNFTINDQFAAIAADTLTKILNACNDEGKAFVWGSRITPLNGDPEVDDVVALVWGAHLHKIARMSLLLTGEEARGVGMCIYNTSEWQYIYILSDVRDVGPFHYTQLNEWVECAPQKIYMGPIRRMVRHDSPLLEL